MARAKVAKSQWSGDGWWGDKLDLLLKNQYVIMRMLQQIHKELDMATIDLSKITQEVTNNTSVTQSVVQLLTNLTTIINNIPPSTDPVTQQNLDALTAALTSNDNTIAGAVVQNTPAQPTPANPQPPAPAPASAKK